MEEERRGEERFEFGAGDFVSGGRVVGRLRNYSEAGLGIVSRERLERGEVLDFEVRVDGESRSYGVSGRVAYCIERGEALFIAGFALTSKERGLIPALKDKRYCIAQGELPEPPAPEEVLLKRGRRGRSGARGRKTTLRTGRARPARRSVLPIVAGVGVVVALSVAAAALFVAKKKRERKAPRRTERRAVVETLPERETAAGEEAVELPEVAGLAPDEREKTREKLLRSRRRALRDEARGVLDEMSRLARAGELAKAVALCDSYLARVSDSPFAGDLRRARTRIEALAGRPGPKMEARAPELVLAPEETPAPEEGPSPGEDRFLAASKAADELERNFDLEAAEKAYRELAGRLTEPVLKARALGRAEDLALIRSLLARVRVSIDEEPVVVPHLGMRRTDDLRVTQADERGFSGESVSRGRTKAQMTVRRSWSNVSPREAFEVFRRTRLDAEGWFALGVFSNDFGIEKRMPECFSAAVEADAGLAEKISEYAGRLGLSVGLKGAAGGLEDTVAAALLRKAVWYEGAGKRPGAIGCLRAITEGYSRTSVAGEAHKLLSGGLVRMSKGDEGARSARERLLTSPRKRTAAVPRGQVLDAAERALESGLGHYRKAMPGMSDAERERSLAQADFVLALALYEHATRLGMMNAETEALQERASFLLYACMKMQTLSLR